MARMEVDILTSALFGLLAGVLLWPPRYVYWTHAAVVIGEAAVLAVVAGLALAVGLSVRRTTHVSPGRFAVGGALAYLVGMALIEATLSPDSPVHLGLYGGLLGCMVVGTVIEPRFERAVAAWRASIRS